MNTLKPHALLAPTLVALLSACGGGGGDEPQVNGAATALAASSETAHAADADLSGDSPTASALALKRTSAPTAVPVPAPAPAPANKGAAVVLNTSIPDSARIAAATATAQSTTNLCAPIRPFYWEIGTGAGKAVSGSLTSPTVATKYTSTMPMGYASASKWMYGAYVTQRKSGVLSADDVKFLTFKSGYTSFSNCLQNQTVDQCLAYQGNGTYVPTTDGQFYYSGGHMEKHASLMGLGGMNNQTLAATIQGQLGSDVKIGYSQPMLAGGGYGTPDSYAIFLRKLINKQLKMGDMLSANAVCTNRMTCPGQALSAPIPPSESWHYGIGHWIEDDPVVGDGAFSSPGYLGFYPWVDASRTYYGIVARVMPQGGLASMQCGRLIRKAWETGTAM